MDYGFFLPCGREVGKNTVGAVRRQCEARKAELSCFRIKVRMEVLESAEVFPHDDEV